MPGFGNTCDCRDSVVAELRMATVLARPNLSNSRLGPELTLTMRISCRLLNAQKIWKGGLDDGGTAPSLYVEVDVEVVDCGQCARGHRDAVL
jgi:hypothetical protein